MRHVLPLPTAINVAIGTPTSLTLTFYLQGTRLRRTGISIRHISNSEAMWRIFGCEMQRKLSNIIRLFVHLRNAQPIVHDEHAIEMECTDKANEAVSDLVRYSTAAGVLLSLI